MNLENVKKKSPYKKPEIVEHKLDTNISILMTSEGWDGEPDLPPSAAPKHENEIFFDDNVFKSSPFE